MEQGNIEQNTEHGRVFAHLEPVVSPATELHLAVLVIKWEPGDVYLTGGLEDAWWDVGTDTLASHHHVGRIGPIKGLTGAAIRSVVTVQ